MITEEQIISWLKKHCITQRKQIKCGIGDDAAVIEADKKNYLLFTTDVVIDGVHFISKNTTAYQIGWKALGVNISDIAAMGGTPLYALVSLGMQKTKSYLYKEIYRGLFDMAKMFNIDIIGGNLSSSDTLFVDIFLVGNVSKKDIVYRNTGKPGDLLFVTGTLGGAQKKKQFSFVPRFYEARKIIKKAVPSAMIDLSDGLVSDAKKLARASNCGFEIETWKIPCSEDADKKNKILSALYDGEDYELLFAVPPDKAKNIPQKINNVPIAMIGKLTTKTRFILKNNDGSKIKICKENFRHFS
ncbi:MAG TPA: thiamine-phosphate kinase [bacterium]|nr:thiamine-phosphate kinase [bacterium]